VNRRPLRASSSRLSDADQVVQIERMLAGGTRLARDADGVIMSHVGLPGDVVHIRQLAVRKGIRFAADAHVTQPGPAYTSPDCNHHPRCGGCDWLDARPELHADWKHGIVVDVLRRVAKLNSDELAVVQPTQQGAAQHPDTARRRVHFQVDHAGRLSLSAARSHERVAVVDCPSLHPLLRAVMRSCAASHKLQAGSEVRFAMDSDGVVFATNDERNTTTLMGVTRGGWTTGHLTGDGRVRGEVTSGMFPALSDARSFTQATHFGGRRIIDEVLAAVAASDSVVELFAGAGHLTVPMAAGGRSVMAVEGDAVATEYLQVNTADQPRVNASRHHIDGQIQLPQAAALVIDPPRTGVSDIALIVQKVRAHTVVMVSCDVATGARDLRRAMNVGYRLQRLTPIDAFPRTHHVEWVAHLQRL
jgi:23S rRNA (uracil1939-C5)-methyltransferase